MFVKCDTNTEVWTSD